MSGSLLIAADWWGPTLVPHVSRRENFPKRQVKRSYVLPSTGILVPLATWNGGTWGEGIRKAIICRQGLFRGPPKRNTRTKTRCRNDHVGWWTFPLKLISSRWFKVPFSSPSWRSLNPLNGSLNHPKKVTLNHQDSIFSSCSPSYFPWHSFVFFR